MESENMRKADTEAKSRKFSVGILELSLGEQRSHSPLTLLEELQKLKDNERLSSEEKTQRMRQIIKTFMEG